MKRLYFIRALEDLREHRLLSLVTVVTLAVAVLIVSAFALFWSNARELMRSWRQDQRMMVYLVDECDPACRQALQMRLDAHGEVAASRFIDRDEALARLRDQLPGQAGILADLADNPLPHAFEIHLVPGERGLAATQRLADGLGALAGVDEVAYGQQWLGRFSHLFKVFTLAGYALGALFVLGGVLIVANTLRLVIYARREEVRIMRLVGASDGFIRQPFYIAAMLQGAAAAGLALAVLFVLFWWLAGQAGGGSGGAALELRFLSPLTVAGIGAAGTLLGWLGCHLSLTQYLKD